MSILLQLPLDTLGCTSCCFFMTYVVKVNIADGLNLNLFLLARALVVIVAMSWLQYRLNGIYNATYRKCVVPIRKLLQKAERGASTHVLHRDPSTAAEYVAELSTTTQQSLQCYKWLWC